jgi:hypothetical protein
MYDLLSPQSFSGWLYIVTVVVAIASLPWVTKLTKSMGFLAYGSAILLVPLSTGSAMSISRFLLANVGQYVVLAHCLKRYRSSWIVFLMFAVLQGIANVYLINWRWVA